MRFKAPPLRKKSRFIIKAIEKHEKMHNQIKKKKNIVQLSA